MIDEYAHRIRSPAAAAEADPRVENISSAMAGRGERIRPLRTPRQCSDTHTAV